MIEQRLSADDLTAMHENTILLRYNAKPPKGGVYQWLESGTIRLSRPIRIEQNAGIYRGPYRPLVGGKPSSGLCNFGAFSYTYSALPDTVSVGRYCSISSGLRFLDSAHPLNTATTSALLFRPGNRLFRN